MNPRKSPSGKKVNADLRRAGLLTAIPAVLIAAPLVGFFIGSWLDKKTELEPLLTITGVVLGFVAAGIETYRLIKKSSALDNEHDD